ncbi:MAG: PAS domain S-box protein [Mariniphaga sp.]|nr:PAS domain S-box protein [Mariniphaga sp.]
MNCWKKQAKQKNTGYQTKNKHGNTSTMYRAHDLLLLLFNLTQLHSQNIIIQLFTEEVSKLFKPASFTFSYELDLQSKIHHELKTHDSVFGYILIGDAEHLSDENKTLIQHAVQMLAVILERLANEQNLEKEKKSLEGIAETRNRDLELTIEELKKARYASLNLIEDLTEEIEKRTRSEKKLMESEERFRLVMENSLDAILITIPDGTILNANKSACRMFQMTEAELCRAGRKGIVNPDDPNLTKLLKERKKKRFVSGELTFIRKDGTLFYGDMSSSVFRDSQGKQRTSLIIRDITERKQVEEKLKNSDRIFEHSVDMMAVAGFDGYLKVINPAWERVLGWTTKEMLADPWISFVHPDDKDETQSIKEQIVDGRKAYRFENRYRCKNGDYKWLSWNAFPYPEENVMFSVARDVTENKLAGEELYRLKNSLEIEVEQKTRELRKHIAELERFQQATIDREFRIKELRDEIKNLKNKTLNSAQ